MKPPHTPLTTAKSFEGGRRETEPDILNQALAQMSEAVLVLDKELRTTYANDAFCRQVGISADDLVGKPIINLGPPPLPEMPTDPAAFEGWISQRGSVHGEMMMSATDGNAFPVFMTITPVLDAQGNTLAYVQTHIDLRKVKQVESRLRESEETFRAISTAAQDAVIMLDDQGRIVFWNDAASRTFGYSTEEAFALDAHAILVLDRCNDREKAICPWSTDNGLDPEVGNVLELEGLRKDGSEFPLELSIASIRLRGGWHVVGILRDITKRKEKEHDLRLFRTLIDHSNDAIEVLDPATLRFLDVNEKGCLALGYTRDEFLSLTVRDIDPTFDSTSMDMFDEQIGRTNAAVFERTHRRKDGSTFPVEIGVKFVEIEGKSYILSIVRDITERRRYIDELEHKALYDTLTELPNRSLLHDRLEYALRAVHRNAAPLAVIILDVVRLREINDLMGHENGDLVLKEVAKRLQYGLRETDTVARLGSDEFVMVLPTVAIDQVHLIAGKIQQLFEQPVIVEGTPLELEVAIGIAQYPDHGNEAETLLQHADIAMHVAKNEASGFCIYEPHADPFSVRRLKLHGELRQAINDETLAVYYQPKVDIKTGRIISVEALARWPHPDDGMIAPADFIPMVEQSGLTRPFTLWVLQQAIEQTKRWSESGIELTVAVNLSTRNLLDPSLADSIGKILDSQQLIPERLILEITESAVMSRPEQALKILTSLHTMGLKLSIDDFGTGYSSLAYLKRLPVSELKIDQSFISGMLRDESDAVIVRSTIELAHNLGLSVVAEGVEDEETLSLLTILRCDTCQGFYFSRPLPAQELENWIHSSPWGR